VKYLLLGHNLLSEGVAAHLVASISAGLAVATTTNPVRAASSWRDALLLLETRPRK
jgi:hypothetical protein